jgi:hypothetical protein
MRVLCTYLAFTTFKYYFTDLTNSHGQRFDDVNENCGVSRLCSMHYPVDSTAINYQYPVLIEGTDGRTWLRMHFIRAVSFEDKSAM